jgi:hypothetical protein
MAAQEGSGFMDDLPHGCYFEPDSLRSEWRPALAHMAGMLNEDKVKEFVDVVGEFHAERLDMILKQGIERALDCGLRQYFALVDDLVTCSRFIRQSVTSASPEGREKEILDVLMKMIQASNVIGPRWNSLIAEQTRLASYALILTKSKYVTNCILESLVQTKERVKAIVDGTKKDCLTSSLIFPSLEPAYEVISKCRLDEMILDFAHIFESSDSSPKKEHYSASFQLGILLGSIQRLDFPPQLVQFFNDKISKIKEKSFVDIYRITLENFASNFEGQYSISLYDQLKKSGMQFFNSEVYKPK